MKSFLICMASILISGCVIYESYTHNEVKGPKARLRLIATQVSTKVYQVMEEDCTNLKLYGFLRKSWHDGTKPENNLDMPWTETTKESIDKTQYKEVFVEADKPLTLYYKSRNIHEYYFITVTFTPAENKNYMIYLNYPRTFLQEILDDGTVRQVKMEKNKIQCDI